MPLSAQDTQNYTKVNTCPCFISCPCWRLVERFGPQEEANELCHECLYIFILFFAFYDFCLESALS
jgi:hypothetical protein